MDRYHAWTVVGFFRGRHQRLFFEVIPEGEKTKMTITAIYRKENIRYTESNWVDDSECLGEEIIKFIDEHVKISDPSVKD